jgi:hypothetical protein
MNYNYITDYELIEQYKDMLNECYPIVKIGEFTFEPATVLYECDPIAFRCGLADYADSLTQDGYVVEGYES